MQQQQYRSTNVPTKTPRANDGGEATMAPTNSTTETTHVERENPATAYPSPTNTTTGIVMAINSRTNTLDNGPQYVARSFRQFSSSQQLERQQDFVDFSTFPVSTSALPRTMTFSRRGSISS